MANAFDVNSFRALLGQGGARPNQFEVLIGGNAELSSFLVTAASLPGQTINNASVFYRGRVVKLAGDRVFAPWTTTIINDTGFTMRTFIEQWMNDIEDIENKRGYTNPQQYFSDIYVNQLDKNGAILKTYTLVGAWPTDISDVPLSFDANDQISAFSCTWQYQSFITSGGLPSGSFVSLEAGISAVVAPGG